VPAPLTTDQTSGSTKSPDPLSPDDLLPVGLITTAWGIRGEVKVRVLSDNPHRFDPGGILYVHGAPYRIERSRSHQKFLLVKLQGIDDRTAAEALRGTHLEIRPSDRPSLPEGHYYLDQLIGLEVRTTDGRVLGTIEEVLRTASNDVYLVRGPGGEHLIPAIKDVVQAVDTAAGVMLVDAIPGLLD